MWVQFWGWVCSLLSGRLFSDRAVTAHFSYSLSFPRVIWPGIHLSNATDRKRAETYPWCQKRYQVNFSLTVDSITKGIVWDSREKKYMTIKRVRIVGQIWKSNDYRYYSGRKLEKYFGAQILIAFLILHEDLLSGSYRANFWAKVRIRDVLYICGHLLLHLQPAFQQSDSLCGPLSWF